MLARVQQAVRQGEGVRVVHLAEDLGQALGELVALCNDHAAEDLLVVALDHEVEDLRLVEAGQVEVCCAGDAVRAEAAVLGAGEHAHVAGEIAVDLHEADGREAVEPGVGHLLAEGVVAARADALRELGALGLLLGREHTAGHHV